MILLCVDASAKSAAVAVCRDGKVVAEDFVNNGFTHSQTLLPMISATLAKGGITIKEIDAFALTNGPGSFTGLRIGCATVKGLAGEKPCYPVSTLSTLACMTTEDGIIIPMMDARRAQTYTASFRRKNGVLEQIAEDRAIAVEQLENEMRGYLDAGEKIIVPGDGGYLLSGQMKELVTLPAQPLITGVAVARAAEKVKSVSAAGLGLRYLRLSQAEREKQEKNGGTKNEGNDCL